MPTHIQFNQPSRLSRFFSATLPITIPLASMLPMYLFLSALGFAGLTLAGLVMAAPVTILICNGIYTALFKGIFSRTTAETNNNLTANWISATFTLTLMLGFTFGVSFPLTALVAFAMPIAFETTFAITRMINRLLGRTPTRAQPATQELADRRQNDIEALRHRLQNNMEAIRRQFRPVPHINYPNNIESASDDNLLLREACFHGRSYTVRALLENNLVRENAAALNNEALRYACRDGHTEIVRQLLAIPSVARNAAFNHNEAARLAEARGHFEIVQLLLAVPQVRDHAIPANAVLTITLREGSPIALPPPRPFFGGFDIGGFEGFGGFGGLEQDTNLRNLASTTQRENAMDSLNAQQHEALRLIQQRYQNVLDQRGNNAILNEIENFLSTQYRRKPIKHQGQNLAFEYNPNLTTEQKQLYYKNKIHTAYRYLFLHPNPWAKPNAPFSRNHPNGGISASISDADKTKIALMWLAATDDTQAMPEGFTRTRIKKQFTDILAQIGRAHNWDHSRPAANGGTEQYDDLLGDSPSCHMGVGQRVVQFLMVFLNDRPESRPLSVDIIKNKFKEELIAEGSNTDTLFSKLAALDKNTLNEFDEAYSDLFTEHLGDRTKLSAAQQALFQRLEPSADAVDAFIDSCKTYYGAARITATDQNIAYSGQSYNSYERYIREIARNCLTDFGSDIHDKVELLKNRPENQNEPQKENAKVLTFSKKSKSDSEAERSSGNDTPARVLPRPRLNR